MSETMATSMRTARTGAVMRRPANGRSRMMESDGAHGRGLGEQRRADRAAQVAQRRDVHGGRVDVVEQMRVHGRGDALRVGLPEADAETAADDDRLDVEHV